MKQLVVLTALLGLAGCAGHQAAQPVTVAPCAASLPPQARKIYDAVRVGPQEGTLHDRIANQTREMVMMGDLPRSEARADALAAADCLHQTP